jgi:thiol-disulfide isomerase/thioredoxin
VQTSHHSAGLIKIQVPVNGVFMIKPINVRRPAWLLLLLVGFLLACFSLQAGQPAPPLELPSLDGGEIVSLTDFEGKVVYVDFWASWCGPCRQSLPLYEAMSKRLSAEQFQILAINLDEDRKDAERFLQRHPVSYEVLFDPDAVSAEAWSVPVMPSSFLVDASGRIAKTYMGFEPSHIEIIENDIKARLENIPAADPD